MVCSLVVFKQPESSEDAPAEDAAPTGSKTTGSGGPKSTGSGGPKTTGSEGPKTEVLEGVQILIEFLSK